MKKQAVVLVLLFLGAVLFQVGLQFLTRPLALDGFYFQVWTSEAMMHTVPIMDLRDAPLETLWHIHTAPPAFDVIRAVLVNLWPAADTGLAILHVDYLLYVFFTLLYGCLAVISFLWLSKLTERKYAILATSILLLHPAVIFYATLLETTFLTALLVLLFYYLIWQAKRGQALSTVGLILVILALFFTRPIFHFPFLIVVAVSLLMMAVPRRKVLIILLITGGLTGLYSVKQYYQFGTFSTSSFTGLNLNRSVGIPIAPDYFDYLGTLNNETKEAKQQKYLPPTLTRIKKGDGTVNLNNVNYLTYNEQLIGRYKDYMLKTSVLKLAWSYLENLYIYFKPSSTFTDHVIVDRLPWRAVYDRVFSFPLLFIWFMPLGGLWFYQKIKYKSFLSTIGFILPALYIFLVSVLFEKGENHRFKFFLEPIIFIFLATQLYLIVKHQAEASFGLCRRWWRRAGASQSSGRDHQSGPRVRSRGYKIPRLDTGLRYRQSRFGNRSQKI